MLPAPVAATSAPIVNGTEDHADPAVVLISWTDQSGSWICSGTLIAPTVVLTARHCVRDEEGDLTPVPQGAHKISFHSGYADDPHSLVATTGYATLPGPANDFGNDIAVIFLAEPAPATIKPVPISVYPGALFLNQPLRLIGYGDTGVGDATSAGVKRTGMTTINNLETQHVGHALNPSGTCQGDSGGAQVVKLGDVEAVAGVTSNGTSGCLAEHDAVRVDSHIDFLKQYVDVQFDKSPPEVTITAPVDGADVAVGFDVTADMSDDHGLAAAALAIDGNPVGSDQKPPWVLKAPANVTVGSHTIEVTGIDVFGNTTKKTITVNVKPACAGDSDCADGQVCSNQICGLALGADCQTATQCASGQCYQSGESSFCTMNCASASECPSGFTCAASGISPVTKCVAEEASGCAVGAAGARGTRVPFVAAMLMLGLLLGLRLRRRDS
jgi:MYXO-CTERM domain-containing protein